MVFEVRSAQNTTHTHMTHRPTMQAAIHSKRSSINMYLKTTSHITQIAHKLLKLCNTGMNQGQSQNIY